MDDYNSEDAYPQNWGSVNEKWKAKNLIIAHECNNVAITGNGMIDGSGDSFFGEERVFYHGYAWDGGYVTSKDEENLRPGQLICFIECTDVKVIDITIKNIPCWGVFFHGCEYVQTRCIKITNPFEYVNTDGIDIDCCGIWGGGHFVDVPNIFPDFGADENDPENYDFHYTDEYIKAIQDAGTETYYRLGVTIEWGSKKYASLVPKDFAKWARICEHIIAHYNEGWANGFEYNLKYWEIWNEPENPGNANGKCMWSGSKEDFFELYKITSKHLKSKFPQIKIGGYGGCGFYELTRTDIPEEWKEFIPYFKNFLKMVKEENCPLDFYSWHIYTEDEKELFTHAKYVRETLDEYGFKGTESHLNEWNIGLEGESFAKKHTMEGGSFLAAVMCELQKADYVDKAMYYCFSESSKYNGFLDQNNGTVSSAWYPFKAFGELYKLKNEADIQISGNIYAMAAGDNNTKAILLSNYNDIEEKTILEVKNLCGKYNACVFCCTEDKHLKKDFSFDIFNETEIEILVKKHTVVLIKFKKK